MKVSVSMVTYNHEKFITQAVESVMAQETDFDFELVLGEDCSTDHTRDIVIELQKKYPTRIRLLLPDKNLGALENFLRVFHACKGQYIAILDGDDYWTSPHKLQKQVEFLDQHLDYSACFHNATIIYEDGSRDPHDYCLPAQKEIITLQHLIVQNEIAAGSILFRRGLFGGIPSWYYKVATGDWALHIMNAQFGNIKYLNENMSVYRIHGQSSWSSLKSIDKTIFLSQMYRYLQDYLEPQYKPLLKALMSRCDWSLVGYYQAIGNRGKTRAYMRKCLAQYGFGKYIPLREYAMLFFWLTMPAFYKFLRALKRLTR